MMSDANGGKMSSDTKSKADAAAKALVESMGGDAPSAAAKDDLTNAGESVKRHTTELALVPERMIARSVLDKDPVDRRSISGYINKTVASFFSHWSMWMQATDKSYKYFCDMGYNPWMRKSGVTVVTSLSAIPKHNDPRIEWDWVNQNFFQWLIRSMEDLAYPSVIKWFDDMIDNNGPPIDRVSIRNKTSLLTLFAPRETKAAGGDSRAPIPRDAVALRVEKYIVTAAYGSECDRRNIVVPRTFARIPMDMRQSIIPWVDDLIQK